MGSFCPQLYRKCCCCCCVWVFVCFLYFVIYFLFFLGSPMSSVIFIRRFGSRGRESCKQLKAETKSLESICFFFLGDPSPSKTNKRRVCVCTRSKQVRGTRRCCCCSRDVRLTFLRLSSQPVTYIHTYARARQGNQPAYMASSPLSPSKAELLPRFKPSDSQKIQSESSRGSTIGLSLIHI